MYFYIRPLFMLFLILATGAALYMGVFRSHRPKTSYTKKVYTGILSYTASTGIWFLLYSHQYMGW